MYVLTRTVHVCTVCKCLTGFLQIPTCVSLSCGKGSGMKSLPFGWNLCMTSLGVSEKATYEMQLGAESLQGIPQWECGSVFKILALGPIVNLPHVVWCNVCCFHLQLCYTRRVMSLMEELPSISLLLTSPSEPLRYWYMHYFTDYASF